MNTEYSDEHLNAYIDGELESEERARLLYDEQNNPALAQRIADARALKEKVQLAYGNLADFERPASKHTSRRMGNKLPAMTMAIAASVMLAVTVFFSMEHISDKDIKSAKQLMASSESVELNHVNAIAATDEKLILDLNKYDPAKFDATLAQLQTLLTNNALSVEVIANGQGLRALDATSEHARAITAMANRFENLNVIACAQTISDFASTESPVDVLSDFVTTRSAPYQVAKRTAEGWLYIKLD